MLSSDASDFQRPNETIQMDEAIIGFLHTLASAQAEFLSSDTIRAINFNSRTSLIARFQNNQAVMLEIASRVYTSHLYGDMANALLTVSMPAIPRNFSDPVQITASQIQINAGLEDIAVATSPCAICQDPISSGGARTRVCRHEYHRSCILNWFSMSVRCPVCRHDIRETGREAQTSTAALRTSSPLPTQSEDSQTSE